MWGLQCCVRLLCSSYGVLWGSSHAAGGGELRGVCPSLGMRHAVWCILRYLSGSCGMLWDRVMQNW